MKSGWITNWQCEYSDLAIFVNAEEDQVGNGFFWPDEPIGHAIHEDILMSKEEAEIDLLFCAKIFSDPKIKKESMSPTRTLQEWRESQIKYFDELNKKIYPQEEYEKIKYPILPEKQEGQEWFNFSHLIKVGDIRSDGKYSVQITRINLLENFPTVDYQYIVKPNWILDDRELSYPIEKFLNNFSRK